MPNLLKILFKACWLVCKDKDTAKIKKQNVAGDCFTSSDHAGFHLQPIWSTDHINMPQSSNILNNQNENFKRLRHNLV